MPRSRLEWGHLLYQALGEPIGLLLQVSDFQKARAALYAARKEAGDPALDGLQLRASPFDGGNLVICKGNSPAKLAAPKPMPPEIDL